MAQITNIVKHRAKVFDVEPELGASTLAAWLDRELERFMLDAAEHELLLMNRSTTYTVNPVTGHVLVVIEVTMIPEAMVRQMQLMGQVPPGGPRRVS